MRCESILQLFGVPNWSQLLVSLCTCTEPCTHSLRATESTWLTQHASRLNLHDTVQYAIEVFMNGHCRNASRSREERKGINNVTHDKQCATALACTTFIIYRQEDLCEATYSSRRMKRSFQRAGSGRTHTRPVVVTAPGPPWRCFSRLVSLEADRCDDAYGLDAGLVHHYGQVFLMLLCAF
jgi:hypothetical protein